MATAHRAGVISQLKWGAAAALAIYFFGSGVFSPMAALQICASCACAYACVRGHIAKRQPESLVFVAAGLIFSIAYTAQAVLFVQASHATNDSLFETISIHSVFSAAALRAGQAEIDVSLQVMLIGFLGLLLPSLYFASRLRGRRPEEKSAELFVSNPMTVGYLAIITTVGFAFLRKHFGLDLPGDAGLPLGTGAVINIGSAYVGPNLSFAALFAAIQQGNEPKAKRLAFLALALGLFNYLLFTSKMSLIFPVVFLLVTQYLLNRWVISTRVLAMLGAAFVLIYPFLNIYRAAVSLGVTPGELLNEVVKMYSAERENSWYEHSALEVGISAILGRFVGYDPLMILVQADSFHGSIIDYLLYGDLDKTLTHDILGFLDPMGYSPGFLGRLFYISRNYLFVIASTSFTITIVAILVKAFWRSTVRLRFMSPLLLTYCLVFFSDGIRFELFRALVVSTYAIYLILRLFAKVRRFPVAIGSYDAEH